MEACPKCNFALAPGAAECPACGVVLSKLKTQALRPIQPVPQNPYAPPAADIASLPVPPPLPAPPAQPSISPQTLEALLAARPWLGFVVGYGSVINTLMIVVALGILFFAADKPALLPLSIIYLAYGAIGFVILAPLRRSSQAAGQVLRLDAGTCVETFIKEQAVFWRRIGWLCAVSLALVVVAGIASMLLGGMAAMMQ